MSPILLPRCLILIEKNSLRIVRPKRHGFAYLQAYARKLSEHFPDRHLPVSPAYASIHPSIAHPSIHPSIDRSIHGMGGGGAYAPPIPQHALCREREVSFFYLQYVDQTGLPI